MVPGSQRTVVVDGQTVIEIQVNHSGIVQLGYKQKVNLGDVSLLLTVLVVLGTLGRRRRER